MPELPEVETVVRDLRRARLAGRAVVRVRVRCRQTVAPEAPRRFARRLAGRRIVRLSRRAKYLVLALDDGATLLVHLRMTGQFHFAAPGQAPGPHDQLLLTLDDGRELWFRDTRKFGRWRVTRAPADALGHLGPEPLGADFTPAWFDRAVARRRRQLKPLLLDQSFVAGIGNIYADEILWAARLHPREPSDRLSAAQRRRLYASIRRVLRAAIGNRGTSLGVTRANFRGPGGGHGQHQERLRVFQRTGAACPRCGARIVRLIVAQRGTHICPRCQRAPAP